MVLIVTEPTLSSLHDFKRIAELCRQFNLKTAICINKADINSEISDQIAAEATMHGIPVLGLIRYDEAVTMAQVRHLSVVESGESAAATDIRMLWERVNQEMDRPIVHTMGDRRATI